MGRLCQGEKGRLELPVFHSALSFQAALIARERKAANEGADLELTERHLVIDCEADRTMVRAGQTGLEWRGAWMHVFQTWTPLWLPALGSHCAHASEA